jgi:hypothetical protein
VGAIMIMDDIYQSMIRGNEVDKDDVIKVYIFHSDLYNDLKRAGPLFKEAALFAEGIRNDCLSYMKKHQKVL